MTSSSLDGPGPWLRTLTQAWAVISDNALVLALLGFGMYGSFGHVVQSAMDHGQSHSMAVSIALTIDLLAVGAVAEIRRRRRQNAAWGHLLYPAGVAVFGVSVQLAANLSTAADNQGAQFYAAWPALAFLLAAGLVETRPGRRAAAATKGISVSPRPAPKPSAAKPPAAQVAPRRPAPALPAAPVAALDPAPVSPPVVERVGDDGQADTGTVPAALVEAARDPEWRAQIKGAGGLMDTYGWTERQAARRVKRARELAAEQTATPPIGGAKS